MWIRLVIMVLALSLVFGGIFGFELFKKAKIAEYLDNFTPAPVVVSAAEADQQAWTPHITSIGTLISIQGVELASEQSGIISKIHFTSGQQVKQGDLLLQLDDRVEQANLRSFKAEARLTRLTFERDSSLIAKKNISQTRIDKSKSTRDQAVAQVQKTEAIIQQKRIRAPFSGKLGIRKVEMGQFLPYGSPIATLQASQKLYVDFNLPEQDIPKLKIGQTVEFSVEAYPDRKFIGELKALDSRVDPNTRNILVRSVVDNDKGLLTPGMFADIRVLISDPEPVTTVPQTAITYSLYGETVFLIEKTNNKDGNPQLSVKRHPVSTGRIQQDRVEVLHGLTPGDRIVTAGQLKLDTGTVISVEEALPGEQQ